MFFSDGFQEFDFGVVSPGIRGRKVRMGSIRFWEKRFPKQGMSLAYPFILEKKELFS